MLSSQEKLSPQDTHDADSRDGLLELSLCILCLMHMSIHRASLCTGLPGGSVVKNPPAKARDPGWIPGSGRSLGEENGCPLQYSCLGNPTDREAWRATVPGVAKCGTRPSK